MRASHIREDGDIKCVYIAHAHTDGEIRQTIIMMMMMMIVLEQKLEGLQQHRQMINTTEEKAEVVASVWGGKNLSNYESIRFFQIVLCSVQFML